MRCEGWTTRRFVNRSSWPRCGQTNASNWRVGQTCGHSNKNKTLFVYGWILSKWLADPQSEYSLLAPKTPNCFQTKMEDLSVEVYGENGAYYKVCKLWSTLLFRLDDVHFINASCHLIISALHVDLCLILTKIFLREDHHGWNGRHVRLTGRDFSMCCNNCAVFCIFSSNQRQ